MSLSDKSERALARMLVWTRGFPNPGPKQAVKSAPFLAVMQKLEPLALEISKLKVGTPKGAYGGAGYFGGSTTITQADVDNASVLLRRIRVELPALGQGLLGLPLLQAIKLESQRLLMVATDMEVDESAGDRAKLLGPLALDVLAAWWGLVKDVVVNIPDVVAEGLKDAAKASLVAQALGYRPGIDSFMPYAVAGGALVLVASLLWMRR